MPEIARRLSLTPEQVRCRHHRAMRRLRVLAERADFPGFRATLADPRLY